MENKFDEKALQQAKAMANSPAGKELMELVKNMDADTLKKMMSHASSGDYSQLSKSLSALMESEKVRQLLQQMEGK